MWKNDTKCKYMFMFLLNNSARKELKIIWGLHMVSFVNWFLWGCKFGDVMFVMTDLPYVLEIRGWLCIRLIFNSFPLDKMAAILEMRCSNAFRWMESFIFWFKFHCSLFVCTQLTISQHWFRLWLGAKWATSHYLSQCWPSSLMHICSTRGTWVNSLRPSDAYIRQ